MANIPTPADLRLVESHLRNLQGPNQLRRLLADLNYPVADGPVSTADWKPELTKTAKDGNLRVIARHHDFVVTHCCLPGLRLAQQRELVTRLIRQYQRGLFIFSDPDYLEWQFVNVKFDEGVDVQRRRLFRRIRVGPAERLRTAIERIALLKVGEPYWTGLQVELKHDQAFDVEAITRAFFDEYRSVFGILQDHLEKQAPDTKWAHDYSLQFLNRLMFLYFVQRKRWLGNEPEFLRIFWEAYQISGLPQDTFFDQWLSVLFFEAFNNRFFPKPYLSKELNEALQMAPYLNGGLFLPNELDSKYHPKISDRLFRQVFTFFQRYNFTITEDSPIDQEVAVDPEMIGKVYESLVNLSELSDERSTAGIFYTPRTEIDLMCRLALVDHLTNHLGQDQKPYVYDAVFALEEEQKRKANEALADRGLWPEVARLLQDVTVVDPACGSGSFLVGMLSVLFDLSRRARAYVPSMEESDYELKKRIIGQNLYGVDMMRWAVNVAELRLWLQLVVETELHPAELKFRPLLPYLSFKVRAGDSLVQEVGGVNLTLRHGGADISPGLRGRTTRLKAEKLGFYNNEPDRRFRTEEDLKHEELDLFRAILDERIHNLQNKRVGLVSRLEGARVQQGQLPGLVREGGRQQSLQEVEIQRQIEELDWELEQARRARQALRTVQDIPFVGDVAFVEVCESAKGGFDIVIGNPPYVRQERIADPRLPREQVTPENKREYKAKLARAVYNAWPHFFGYKPAQDTTARKLDAKSDLYIYFYFLSLGLLNAKGSFCFITSNSWLDVGYGKDLQEFLLRHSQVKMVLDNRARRSFSQADINTVIVLLAPPDEREEWGLEKTARFVMFFRPFEYVLFPEVFWSIEDARERESNELFRVNPVPQRSLLEDGLEQPEDQEEAKPVRAPLIKGAPYIGNKWGGKYLRAPDIFFTILEKGKGKLVRLGDIAEVRRGFTTGANEFFYLEPTGQPAPPGLIHVRNGAGWEGLIEEEFLKPVLRRPRECECIGVEPEQFRYKVLLCHKDRANLRGARVLRYIDWAETFVNVCHNEKCGTRTDALRCPKCASDVERDAFPERPTCRSRALWYDVGEHALTNIAAKMTTKYRHYFPGSPMPFLVDHRFYEVRPISPDYLAGLLVSLNSAVTALYLESTGRAYGGGGGPLDIMVYEMERILIVDPRLIETPKPLWDADIAKRPVLHFWKEAELPDRQALDKVVFEALGLTEEEQLEVYRAVVQLVKDRLSKARSV